MANNQRDQAALHLNNLARLRATVTAESAMSC
jgi:hypothetical protein